MIKTNLFIVLFVCMWQGLWAGVNEVRIFGEVTTVTNKKITGYISWGKNNLYWVDLFTAMKISNPYISYFKGKDSVLFKNDFHTEPGIHVFSCRFGNIKSIRPIAADRVELQIKNGNIIELRKDSLHDIGENISIEKRDGEVEMLSWELISEVEFCAAPKDFSAPRDVPIVGIVTTPYGKFKGIVRWNGDKNSLRQTISGIIGKYGARIAFSNIVSIRKKGFVSVVNLKSGREVSLWGESDVNEENRGIFISMASVGQVCVEWPDFISFETVALKDIKQMGYEDFSEPVRLKGRVEDHDGRMMEGILVYDLDEAMDFELLEGRNGNTVYALPLRYVKKIEPKNYEYTWVELKNGTKLILGKYNDVNAKNEGVLLFRKGEEPEYFRWRIIKRINLWESDIPEMKTK